MNNSTDIQLSGIGSQVLTFMVKYGLIPPNTARGIAV